MNINQLKYVLEVAASSSMREAATKLFVTQPALSASIHELEEDCCYPYRRCCAGNRSRKALKRALRWKGPGCGNCIYSADPGCFGCITDRLQV